MRALLLSLAVWFALAPAADAVTPQEAIAKLNAQRAAHGIPAGIVEVPEWSAGCANHGSYIAQNGGVLVHDEEPGKPGYTADGDDAGNRAVLAGVSWASGNPWETAPIHLHQMLNPRLSRSGAADTADYSCFITQGGSDGPVPAATTVYTYPGPGTTHRFSETAREAPYTPGERVGIAAGTATGPYLYLMVDAPAGVSAVKLDSATLTGPDGPVEVRLVDNQTSGLEFFLPPGAQVIPVNPLKPGTSYTAVVRMTATLADATTVPVDHQWSFTTSGKAPATPPPTTGPGGDAPSGEAPSGEGALAATRLRTSRRRLTLTLRCNGGPCSAAVSIRWRGRRRSLGTVAIAAGATRRVRASITRRQRRSLRGAKVRVFADGTRIGSL